jgi:hypothetical protein
VEKPGEKAMNQPTRQTLVEQFIQQRSARLSSELDKVEDLMKDINPTARVELDEFYFRAFVDVFTGEEKMMYFGEGEEARRTALRTWTNVATSMLHEVDVYGLVEGKRTLLFTVPPLLDREMMEPTEKLEGRPSVYGAVVNAGHISNMSKSQGEQYLIDYLGERLTRMYHPETMLKNAAAWNKIFAFYGRKPLVPAISNEKDQKNNGNISNDEVVGFDPL